MTALRILYPEARIDHGFQADKLSIYGGVKENISGDGLMARIRAKLYRRIANWKWLGSPKYKD